MPWMSWNAGRITGPQESSPWAVRAHPGRKCPTARAMVVLGAVLGAGGSISSALASDDPFFSELPIVASISRLPQRSADAPTSVTVIDRETIRASGIRSLSDIFRLVPGFQTFASSDVAARVNYHGVADEDFSPRVQVLVDGRSLHSPLFQNGMNWAMVPVALEDIERIEVVRGSNTTSYGSNAFLGVINIITVDPALVRGVSVSTNYGNQGVRDLTVRGGGALGDAGGFRITAQELRDTGLDHRSSRNVSSLDWRDRNQSRLFDLRANYQLTVQDLFELHLGRVEGRRLVGRVVPATGQPRDINPLRNLDEASTWLQMRWLRTFSDSADLSLRYTWSRDSGGSAFDHPQRPPGFARVDEDGDRGTRHEVEVVGTFLPAEQSRLVVGASWRADRLESKTMLHGQGTVDREVTRVFANGEWRPREWFTGNAGVSYENDQFAGSHVAPRASASFHLTPENTVRVGFARAWRTAGTLDYRANFLTSPTEASWVGNRDLPAERLDTWELGYLGDWRALRMSLDVRYFREQLNDRLMNRIRSGRIPDGLENMPNTVESVQNIRIRGYEVQWKWQPLTDTRVRVGHARIRIDSRDNTNGRALRDDPESNYHVSWLRYQALAEDSAPRDATSLMLMQRLPFGADLSIMHYRVGAMKWTRNTDVGRYHRTDLRLAYPFTIGPQQGEIAYTVQSLNGAHQEQRRQRVVDRRHWVSLRLDF